MDYDRIAEMIDKVLDLYAELPFTEEAEIAFEEKLSEFVGEEVSFSERRTRNRRNRG